MEHVVHDRPVAPGAALLALAVEACGQLLPGATVRQLRDVSFIDLVRADPRIAGPTKYRIRAVLLEPPTGPQGEDGRVRVEVLSDITSRNGHILRRDRLHARIDVLTGPRDPAPACDAPGTGHNRSLPDPYTWSDGPISLTGVFRNVFDWDWSDRHCTARWCPPLAPRDSISHTALPVLLFDALMRLAILPLEGPRTRLKAPVRIGRVDLYQGLASDAELAVRHPAGLVLHRRRGSGHAPDCWATGADDRVLHSFTDHEEIELDPPALAPSLVPPAISQPRSSTPGSPGGELRHGPPTTLTITGTAPRSWFTIEHVVTVGDTSAVGPVYYARLIDWQGRCHEHAGMLTAPRFSSDLPGSYAMVTQFCSCEYLKKLVYGDRVAIRLTVRWVRLHLMKAGFVYHRITEPGQPDGELIARGEQLWASTRQVEGHFQPCPWPRELADSAILLGADTRRAQIEPGPVNDHPCDDRAARRDVIRRGPKAAPHRTIRPAPQETRR
ncbi:hypothetical protein [Streptomyces sp. NPDC056632]|uniref:hypothetical protein n=1 Tax=Streptomyces sp. NPDC056632 TaxID=3345884 RepID=UPI0036C69138